MMFMYLMKTMFRPYLDMFVMIFIDDILITPIVRKNIRNIWGGGYLGNVYLAYYIPVILWLVELWDK